MIYDFRIPKMGQSATEADIIAWLVVVGDVVEAGTHLCEIETDKLSLELEAEVSGTVVEVLVDEGTTVAIGDIICRIELSGE